jgi:hypothetical protein
MTDLYIMQAYAIGSQWDCAHYGWYDQGACQRAEANTLAYLGLLQALQSALEICDQL